MHKTVSPDNSDGSIEQLIVAKGKTAARVTPADVADNIAAEHYFTGNEAIDVLGQPAIAAHGLLTFCVMVLKNGFTVTGESACASPENFDAEIGRRIARENAIAKIWPLMGYALRQQLNDIERANPPKA